MKDSMNPRLIIIVPFYNAKEFLHECLDSVLMQSYQNWLVVCADDGSDDGSSEQIPDDQRMIRLISKTRRSALVNITHAILQSGINYQDEDIICFLDGDDKLLGDDALKTIINIYHSNPHCLITYGNLVTSTDTPVKCNSYTRDEYDHLRELGFRIKPLRTFKWKLYEEFLRQDPDLLAYRDHLGQFFSSAYDVAMFIPLLEIAGYHGFVVNKRPIYWYRRYEKNNDVMNPEIQKETARQVMVKKPFSTAFEPLGYRISRSLYSKARIVYRWTKKMVKGNRS
jgi:glycosyltransferase involved in cell wall biosynthesis